MKSLILINILSNNTVARLNKFIKLNQKDLGKTTVIFCSPTEENRHWKLKEKIDFKYQVLPNFQIKLKGKDLFTYFINPSIFKILNKQKPDRLIITGWDLFAYQAAFFWGTLNKKRITLWSGSTANEKSWRRTITLPLVKLFVHLSTDYIAYGSRSRDYLISLGAKPGKIKIFLNDVNGKYFQNQSKKLRPMREQIKQRLGVQAQKNFLFVGQLIERKGILDLLKAYRIFYRLRPNWGLVIVGYGQLEDEVKTFANKNKLKKLICLSQVDQYDLPPVYASCDILVLPSREEVWGLVINEALHSSLKVIVGDKCGCVPDLIKPGENGYIFKSGSQSSLLNALTRTIRLKT